MKAGSHWRGTSRFTRLGATALSLALVVAAGACGASDAEEPSDSETAAANRDTPTDEPTKSEPPETTTPSDPDETEPEDNLPEPEPPDDPYERELYDVTVEFYAAVAEAYRTLDLSRAEDSVVPGSGALSGYADYINSVSSKGNSFDELPEFVITDFNLVHDEADSAEEVQFRLYASGLKEVDANGDEVATIDESWSDVKISFFKQERKWLVATQDVE